MLILRWLEWSRWCSYNTRTRTRWCISRRRCKRWTIHVRGSIVCCATIGIWICWSNSSCCCWRPWCKRTIIITAAVLLLLLLLLLLRCSVISCGGLLYSKSWISAANASWSLLMTIIVSVAASTSYAHKARSWWCSIVIIVGWGIISSSQHSKEWHGVIGAGQIYNTTTIKFKRE